MELMPKACPKCGDRMSSPIPGRRTGLLIAVCRNGECLHTERSSSALVAEGFKPTQSDHGAMFRPSTTAPEPPRPRATAMEQFQRAAVSGTLRDAIKTNRQKAAAAAAIDSKLKQLGERDR